MGALAGSFLRPSDVSFRYRFFITVPELGDASDTGQRISSIRLELCDSQGELLDSPALAEWNLPPQEPRPQAYPSTPSALWEARLARKDYLGP